MSADNAIAILRTHDTFFRDPTMPEMSSRMADGPASVWRVAHIGNPETFGEHLNHTPHLLGQWMESAFGDAPAFLTKIEADRAAADLYEQVSYVEHGIVHYDARPYAFPGC